MATQVVRDVQTHIPAIKSLTAGQVNYCDLL